MSGRVPFDFFAPTALHMAAVKTQGSGPMVQLLIARGHVATSKNRYGWTALDFAKQVCWPHYRIHQTLTWLFYLEKTMQYTQAG